MASFKHASHSPYVVLHVCKKWTWKLNSLLRNLHLKINELLIFSKGRILTYPLFALSPSFVVHWNLMFSLLLCAALGPQIIGSYLRMSLYNQQGGLCCSLCTMCTHLHKPVVKVSCEHMHTNTLTHTHMHACMHKHTHTVVMHWNLMFTPFVCSTRPTDHGSYIVCVQHFFPHPHLCLHRGGKVIQYAAHWSMWWRCW